MMIVPANVPAVQQHSSSSDSDNAVQPATENRSETRASGRKRSLSDVSTPTRSSSRHVYLVGKTIESFAFKKLPSNEEVLQRLHNIIAFNQEKTLAECIAQTAAELLELWQKSSIPTIAAEMVTERITAMYEEWLELKEISDKRKKVSDNQKKIREGLEKIGVRLKELEDKFKCRFGDLFDISHPNADQMLNEEDRKFLNLQRSKERTGYISTRAEKMQVDGLETRG